MRIKTSRVWILSAVLFVIAALPSLADGAEPTGLVLASRAGMTSLSLDGAEPFHRTADAVIGDRLIDVADSSVRIALWSQVGQDGAAEPHYAISIDGRSLATVRRTSYVMELRHGSFDPAVDVPTVEAALSAGAGGNLHLVQFVTQPLEEYRSAIRALGGTVHKFVANHAHFVTMTPDVRDAVLALPYVRWVGPVHPAYKLEEEIQEQLLTRATIEPRRYSIMLHERGPGAQARVAARIDAIGGEVHGTTPRGFRIEATLSLTQVRALADLDDVMFIDRKGEIEVDMDIVREIGGANYLETVAGFAGRGVRAEIADTEIDIDHVEWSAPPIVHVPGGGVSHGTSVYGILFAQGVNPQARGLIPEGVGIFANSTGLLGGGPTRYQHTAELIDPAGPYRAVLQTNSTGDPQTSSYTTISAEMDDLLFIYDIALTQSQSNVGNQSSRPQAWAKNIISCGAVNHFNTETRDDDCWCGTGSIGPAADGRIKPDLSFFYDDTFTASAGNVYTEFGGTSGATPSVAGYLGLFFQMWSEEVFGNEVPVPGGTVFENRPHMTTAKAAMINTASPWPFSGTGDDMARTHQGWGIPGIQQLYDVRDKIALIDETELLGNMESVDFVAFVPAGEPELRATLVYADPMGSPGAGVHRVNDLSLKLTSPSEVVYWGNNGLLEGAWSVSGGEANTIDTVENVFVQSPESGVWIVEVIASEVNEDGHPETLELDADFALVVSGADMANCSSKGRIQLDSALFACGDVVAIRVVDCDLNTSDSVIDTVTVNIASTEEPDGETVVLTEVSPETADFRGVISLDTVGGSGVLKVSALGDIVTSTYVDADDGQGGTDVITQATADVDCVPPVIFNVQSSDVTGRGATITWETDEPADSLVSYGLAVPDLTEAVGGFAPAHLVNLSGLDECTLYNFSVSSVDQAGNSATNDNAGAYFTFETGRNVEPTYTTLDPPISIPDDNPAGAEQAIFVPDDQPIVDVNVEVNVTHTFTGDLELSLIAPDGTEIVLSDRHGGSGNNFTGTVFDDEAETAIGQGSAPFTGSFRPDEPLSILYDTSSAGQWRLRVEDHAGADTGTLDSWSIHLAYPPRVCGPHLEQQTYTMVDSCAGFGSGGSNGRAEPAENVLLNVTVRNDGSDELTGIAASLTTQTPGVTITQSVTSYPDLAAGEAAGNPLSPFAFTIDHAVPCGEPIVFEFDSIATEGAWTEEFTIVVGDTPFGPICGGCLVFAPGLVETLGWTTGDTSNLQWSSATGAGFYNLYRGVHADLPNLGDESIDSCKRLSTTSLASGNVLHEEPAEGSLFWYLVRAGNGGGQGPSGEGTAGARIQNEGGACP
jgi:subtilisin-like proprotein convertase family protein